MRGDATVGVADRGTDPHVAEIQPEDPSGRGRAHAPVKSAESGIVPRASGTRSARRRRWRDGPSRRRRRRPRRPRRRARLAPPPALDRAGGRRRHEHAAAGTAADDDHGSHPGGDRGPSVQAWSPRSRSAPRVTRATPSTPARCPPAPRSLAPRPPEAAEPVTALAFVDDPAPRPPEGARILRIERPTRSRSSARSPISRNASGPTSARSGACRRRSILAQQATPPSCRCD